MRVSHTGNIGDILRTLRKSFHITQSELAEYIGVSAQQIHKYEIGKDMIGIDKLKGIADFFNCDISLFFEKQTQENSDVLKIAENKKQFIVNNVSRVSDEIQLLKIFTHCEENDKKKILEFATNILEKKKK